MTGKTTKQSKAAAPQNPLKRRVRADAQRSTEALLNAAKTVFARSGVDAPVREISDEAGVGIGTVYRNFATRADLVAAVFRSEVDACAAEAGILAEQHTPIDALSLWLHRYTKFIAAKKGLASALHSGDPAFAALPDYFREHFEPALARLLEAAASASDIRQDVMPYDLLRAIGNLSSATGEDSAAHIARMVDLLVYGLRYSQSCSD